MKSLRCKFNGDNLCNITDQLYAEFNLFPGHCSCFLKGFKSDQDVSVSLGPCFNNPVNIPAGFYKGIPSPEAAGCIVPPGEFQVG